MILKNRVKNHSKVTNRKKLNIILDLDQTLISAEEVDKLPLMENDKKVKKFRLVEMEGYYHIFERPGLQNFLDFVFKNFNVTVWTAGDQAYGLFIIDKIVLANKPERKLDYAFFLYHCEMSEKHKRGIKDLDLLWDIFALEGYNNHNTFIVDDNEEVFSLQPENCVAVTPFEFQSDGSEKDKFLLRLKHKLASAIRKKSLTKDVKGHIRAINTSLKGKK